MITRDRGFGEPFRGVVPIFSGEIAKDFAFYFSESEQTPSAVALGVYTMPEAAVSEAGGLLVQLLPGVTDSQAFVIEQRIAEMGSITSLMRSGLGPEQWIRDLFAGDAEILDSTPVRFLCGCSETKVEAAVKMLGADEVSVMLEASRNRPERVTCEFCKKSYELSMPRMQRLLDEIVAETTAQ
jgi:molecular chaperone Hsp33